MAKAEAAEQKALDAHDDIAREQAWRDAARQWERAIEREKDGKRRALYEQNAGRAREQADAFSDAVANGASASEPAKTDVSKATPKAAPKASPSELN